MCTVQNLHYREILLDELKDYHHGDLPVYLRSLATLTRVGHS